MKAKPKKITNPGKKGFVLKKHPFPPAADTFIQNCMIDTDSCGADPDRSTPPVNVAIPNTTDLKMRAILALAEANKSLAQAIDGVNVKVEVSNNTISGSETGITIGMMK